MCVCGCVYGGGAGGQVAHCWKQRTTLDNARRLHVAQDTRDPSEKLQTTKVPDPHSTGPCEHLVSANFAFTYNQEF